MSGIFGWIKDKMSGQGGPSIFTGFCDYHSHLLPGVDDGVKSMEESLSLLSAYEELGFAELWLTPHIMEDVPNTTEHLREVFAELQSNYKGAMKLHLASENMIDQVLTERIVKRDVLPIMADKEYLLVETSYFAKPNNFYKMLEVIMSKGLTPLLAHPERYTYMGKTDYEKLRKMGVYFQLNLLSLLGHYGKSVKEKAIWLATNNYYKFSGTDTHNTIHSSKITGMGHEKKYARYLGN